MLQEFLIKDNIFDVESKEPKELKYKREKKIKEEDSSKKQEVKLKNSFCKILIIMIYYEKTLFEGLNKVTIDLKRISRNEFYQNQYNQQIMRYHDVFSKMTALLDQVKEMKIYNVNGMAVDTSEIENGGNYIRKKGGKNSYTGGGVRNIRKRFSTKKTFKIEAEMLRSANSFTKNYDSINNLNDYSEENESKQEISNNNILNLDETEKINERIYKNNKMNYSPTHRAQESKVRKMYGFSPRNHHYIDDDNSRELNSMKVRISFNNILNRIGRAVMIIMVGDLAQESS